MDSNQDILNRAIGRPAMMAFMILVGTYLTTGQLIPGVLMENKNQSRNIDPQKIRIENLNGRFALVSLIALVGAYITTGQIVLELFKNICF